ncbi:MAG: hypothetical protein V3W44_05060 [Dehalococcoidales bacterium]
MSLETWKKEFYPTLASRCSKGRAVAHSLRKWRGMLNKNLKRHGLKRENCVVIDGAQRFYFIIDSGSCALCKHYIDVGRCRECPLSEISGRDCGDARGPYERWMKTGNAKPMIKALEKALEREKEAKKEKGARSV